MNTNRIKQALADGKAIQCDNAAQKEEICRICNWDYYPDFDYNLCVWGIPDEGGCASVEEQSCCIKHGREVIPFTALTRSRLAECLGVDDGQKFIFKNDVYSVEGSGEKLRQWSSDGMNFWREMEIDVLLYMLAHPEEITPCPRWSEDSVMRAAALLTCGLESLRRTAGAARGLYVSDGVSEARLRSDVFLEIHPGATVKLEDIK